MTDMLDPIVLNFLYAFIGGVMTIFFMWMGCKVFGHIVNFSIQDKLAEGNVAVGLMMMGIAGTDIDAVLGDPVGRPGVVATPDRRDAAVRRTDDDRAQG